MTIEELRTLCQERRASRFQSDDPKAYMVIPRLPGRHSLRMQVVPGILGEILVVHQDRVPPETVVLVRVADIERWLDRNAPVPA